MTPKYNTVSVPTNTLKVGDVIVAHGGLFRVIEVKVSEWHGTENGACHANYCEFLGNVWDDQECSIPVHWRDGREAGPGRPKLDNFWNQQGNSLARTALVTNYAG